jgi:hypothetical protein
VTYLSSEYSMKKFFVSLTLAVLFTLTMHTSQVLAYALPSATEFDTAYTVTNNNDLTLKSVYEPGEFPWAFVQFAQADLNSKAPLWVNWVWQSTDNPAVSIFESSLLDLTGNSSDKQIWHSPDATWWTANGTPGSNWLVHVGWYNYGGVSGGSDANFSVAPEPVSTLLFLFGGAPLAGALLRKRKRL